MNNIFYLDEGIVKLYKYCIKYTQLQKVLHETTEDVEYEVYNEELDKFETKTTQNTLYTEIEEPVNHEEYFVTEEDKNNFYNNIENDLSITKKEVIEINTSNYNWIEGRKFETTELVEKAIEIGEKDYLYNINNMIALTKDWVNKELEKGIDIGDKHYTCTLEKQFLLTQQITLYLINKQTNGETELFWNETGEPNTDYNLEDLLTVYNAMNEYIKPIVLKQQQAEISLKNATTVEEIKILMETEFNVTFE